MRNLFSEVRFELMLVLESQVIVSHSIVCFGKILVTKLYGSTTVVSLMNVYISHTYRGKKSTMI